MAGRDTASATPDAPLPGALPCLSASHAVWFPSRTTFPARPPALKALGPTAERKSPLAPLCERGGMWVTPLWEGGGMWGTPLWGEEGIPLNPPWERPPMFLTPLWQRG